MGGKIGEIGLRKKENVFRALKKRDFNTYGSRRSNDEVMARGAFANIRFVNKLLKGEFSPKIIHVPTGDKLNVYDAAMKYEATGQDTIILAGSDYGSGSSRDWAAKGPMLVGVKAVIAKSFERESGRYGIITCCFKAGEDADTLGLTGLERHKIHLPSKICEIRAGQDVTITTDTRKSFTCSVRFNSKVELAFFNHGAILPFIIQNLNKE
ncbi:aconitate hydratase, cytoplasmic [Gossypium arboreum]|uniref:Aconitase A/isopropylmalate dehydratase small subunit swivel domain-containing protein n=1 Tax=Gossypium arboreum TaxID=29729 RepID=A0ABR0QZJ6_GOSAR|nr:aconitate hydratase, cytoplasmic [Gossypium arboreum]KAK5844755.1 hypothetical protein PVK06_000896 [Gossypium arboreum]